MKRYLYRWFAGFQIGCVLLTGCHPTQPFFLGERSDLAHYLDKAQQIEYVDLNSEPLPEASQSHEPFSLTNQNFEVIDLSLEECIAYALNNLHIVQTLPGSQRQNADMAATILSSQSQQLSTSSDPAITATTTNSQPAVTDQNGNRVLPRGAARANQVGGVEDALSEFDAQYTSFISYNTTDRARNVGAGNVFNPQLFVARDTTAQAAISKRLATGGVATIRSQSIGSFNNIPTQSAAAGNFGRAVPTDYTQIFEAQVQHPLLRGRGTLVNRIPVILARINEDISIGQYEERIRNLVRDVEYAYWDLFAAYFNVDTAKTAVDSAGIAWKIANAKLSNSAKNAEAQARVTYHQFKAQLDAAIAGGGTQGNDPGLYGREQNLRLLMGWAANDGRLIRPSDKPAIGLAQFDWETARAETLCRNIDLRNHKWSIKQRELELMSAKNQALADVNVSLSYRWLGVGSNLIDRQGGNAPFPTGSPSAFEELFGGNYQEGTARVEFNPNAFGSRRQLNDVQNKQLSLAREHRILEQKEIAAIHRLSAIWQLVDSQHKQLTQQFQALSAAQTLVEVSQAKFDAGDSGNPEATIDNLVRAQQTRSQAGQNYIRALTEYNKSIIDFHAIKGSLLEYNNIMLEEGLWPQKAYWDAEERARERSAARHMDYGASRPSVISRGTYVQNVGTANAQARPASSNPGGPAPENKSTSPMKPQELVPAIPDRAIDQLPEKRTNFNSKPKFKWENESTRN